MRRIFEQSARLIAFFLLCVAGFSCPPEPLRLISLQTRPLSNTTPRTSFPLIARLMAMSSTAIWLIRSGRWRNGGWRLNPGEAEILVWTGMVL